MVRALLCFICYTIRFPQRHLVFFRMDLLRLPHNSGTIFTTPFFTINFCTKQLNTAGLPPECASWVGITVVNLKNNKVLDVGNLPGAWPELTRLYLGRFTFICDILFHGILIWHCEPTLNLSLVLVAWFLFSRASTFLFLCFYFVGTNLLTSIPFEIGQCTKLREVDFSW